ncbi:MAG: alpha-1,2-fucosyltransferase [Thermodesulfobacteriota bacterium]
MFQYALGRRLALERNVPLKLDLSWFETQNYRRFGLDRFRICAGIAEPSEIHFFKKDNWPSALQKVFKGFRNHFPFWLGQVLEHPSPVFNPAALQVPKNAYLAGYWQSEQYFSSISSILLKELQLKKSISPENCIWLEKTDLPFSVSVHVRRTDYVDNPIGRATFASCAPDYYRQAAAMIMDRIPEAFFLVFSDDISWVRDNMDFLSPACFVETVGPDRDEEELILMSHCRHHIIANSSYSWWGAWLCENPLKMVFAPRKWYHSEAIASEDLELIRSAGRLSDVSKFREITRSDRDLIPDRWIKI